MIFILKLECSPCLSLLFIVVRNFFLPLVLTISPTKGRFKPFVALLDVENDLRGPSEKS